MKSTKVDQDVLPRALSVPTKHIPDWDFETSMYVNAPGVRNRILADLDRQSFKESKLKFWCVQAGLATTTAFLKSLAAKKAELQSSYEAGIAEVNATKKFLLVWDHALQARSATNRVRRRDKISNAPKKSYLRARKTCASRGCYADSYGNFVYCYAHHMKDIGKSPRGVSK